MSFNICYLKYSNAVCKYSNAVWLCVNYENETI